MKKFSEELFKLNLFKDSSLAIQQAEDFFKEIDNCEHNHLNK
jgi:hypothetical protein